MLLLARIFSVIVILLSGVIVLSVLALLPDLLADWTSEPESLIGSMLLATVSIAVAVALGLPLWKRRALKFSGLALVMATGFAAAAVFTLLNGGWPVALILSGVAAVLVIAYAKPRKP